MKSMLLILLAAVLGVTARAQDPKPDRAPIVILKLDDITRAGAPAGQAVSANWQRVTDYIVKNKLKGSFGIIGFSLEEDNAVYFDWIKKLQASGVIEFWNHGYKNRKGTDKQGEFEGDYEAQKESLVKTQRLAREKLNIELRVFGAHWSGCNEATVQALAELPEIKAVFYEPRAARQFVFPRIVTLEYPTHAPNFQKFKEQYELRKAASQPVLAVQGHPNGWDEKRWAEFVKIIEFLRAQGCVFMTPSEYLKQAGK